MPVPLFLVSTTCSRIPQVNLRVVSVTVVGYVDKPVVARRSVHILPEAHDIYELREDLVAMVLLEVLIPAR